jgi:hypothetical protein
MGDRPRPGEPERALMRAVLEDAIRCLAGEGRPLAHRAQLAAKARNWVATCDTHWPYSFDNVCSGLDLEPDRVRARLLGSREVLTTICTRVARTVLAS